MKRLIPLIVGLVLTVSSMCQIVNSFPYNEGFENSGHGWGQIDEDNWGNVSDYFYDYIWTWDVERDGLYAHSGQGYAYDESSHWGDPYIYYESCEIPKYFKPKNWLVSPRITLPNNATSATLTFYSRSYNWCHNTDYENHNFCSWCEDTTPHEYIEMYTAPAPARGNVTATTFRRGTYLGNADIPGEWTQVTCDLTPFIGQGSFYFAILHSYRQNQTTDISVDDIAITVTYEPIPDTHYVENNYEGCDTVKRNNQIFTHDTSYTITTCNPVTSRCTTTTTNIIVFHSQRQYDTVVVTDTNYYDWQGNHYTSSGDYHVTEAVSNGCVNQKWLHLTISYTPPINPQTYTYQTREIHRCLGDSYNQVVYLHDTVLHNADTSLDNIVYTDSIIIHPTYYLNPDIILVTDTDFYTWRGMNYTTSGTYYDSLLTQMGCDSIYSLTLTIQYQPPTPPTPPEEPTYTYQTRSVDICGQNTYRGIIFTHDSVLRYVDTSSSMVIYSDSVIVHPNYDLHDSITLDNAQSYTWPRNDSTYAISTEHTIRFNTRYGCDSLHTLHLMLRCKETYGPTTDTSACQSITWDGTTYTAGRETSTHYTLTKILTNQCGADSILYISLTVLPTNTIHTQMQDCDAFDWHGRHYTSSTTDTFTRADRFSCSTEILHLMLGYSTYREQQRIGCDSIVWDGIKYYTDTTIATSILDINKCYNTVITTITIGNNTQSDLYLDECESYQWHDSTFTYCGVNGRPSFHESTYIRQNRIGCDSTVRLHLTLHTHRHTFDTILACEQYLYQGNNYYETRELEPETLISTHGCDSFAHHYLIIGHTPTAAYDTLIGCDSILYNNNVYLHSTTQQYNTTTVYGCDSLTNLTFNIYPTQHTHTDTTACDSILWNQSHYYQSSSTQLYYHTKQGCDSIVTVNIHIHPSVRTEVDTSACDSIRFFNNIYFSNHTAYDTLQSVQGCDSIVVINLLVLHGGYTMQKAMACDSFVWHNATYYQSTVFDDTIGSGLGCDSITTLVLDIHYAERGDYYHTTNQPYAWHDSIYTQSGDYTYHSHTPYMCDSVAVLHLTYITTPDPQLLLLGDSMIAVNLYPSGATEPIQYYAYRWYYDDSLLTDEYADVMQMDRTLPHGCIHVECALDTAHTYWRASAPICIGMDGIEKPKTAMIATQPNPVTAGNTINIILPYPVADGQLTVYNTAGQVVHHDFIQNSLQCTTKAEWPAGVYFVHIISRTNSPITAKVIVR